MSLLLLRASGVVSGAYWGFGLVCLIVGLAVLAAMPVLQLISLGYLLEAAGRVARSGRLREGFPGVRLAGRVGESLAGIWLCVLLLELVSAYAESAELIDPGGPVATMWRAGVIFLTVMMAVHLAVTVSSGGRIWQWLSPWMTPLRLWRLLRTQGWVGWYVQAREDLWELAIRMRLLALFWLGVRGLAAGLIWLLIPVSILAVAHEQSVLLFVGLPLLAWVSLHVPFALVRLAAENRFLAGLSRRETAAAFRRAPVAFALALAVTLVAAVPLYLAKIETVPREAAWLVGVVFIVFLFPAKLATGWAWSRAARRSLGDPAWRLTRWTVRPLMWALALAYAGLVYLSRYTSWNGIGSVYEQHAFLLPAPLIGQ